MMIIRMLILFLMLFFLMSVVVATEPEVSLDSPIMVNEYCIIIGEDLVEDYCELKLHYDIFTELITYMNAKVSL